MKDAILSIHFRRLVGRTICGVWYIAKVRRCFMKARFNLPEDSSTRAHACPDFDMVLLPYS